MKNILSLLFPLTILISGCNLEEWQNSQIYSQDGRTFTASFEQNETRTYIENGNLLRWNAGDQISLFDGNTLNRQYQFDGKTGDNAGTFSMVNASFGTGNDLECHYALYPYDSDSKISDSGIITATLPAEQSYAENSFGLGANTMVAVTKDVDDTFLKFKNVGGYLKLQLYGDDVTVKSITLAGNNNEKIAGTATITTSYSGDPTISIAEDANETITLNCGEGVKVGTTAKTATAFWIVVPPTTFKGGFEITITDTHGSIFTKSTSKEVVIERNILKQMAVLEFDGVIPHVYELSYTTNDGEPLDPYTTEGFGANFIENIYNSETGEGALKFDGQITCIPSKAFVACTNLSKINLTTGITAINAEAFSSCYNLTKMDIPEGVITIGNKAFFNCSGITEVTIPSSVSSIGKSSFEGCGGKAYINCAIPSISSTIGTEGMFYNTKFTKAIISDSVTAIGSYAFCGCDLLTDITISNSTALIGNFAFSGCTSLTSVTIGNSVTTIGRYAFDSCTALASVTIPDSVTSIEDCAFQGCSSLTDAIIGNGVSTIGKYAFCECVSLASVTIGNGVTEIGWSAFSDCDSLNAIHYKGNLSDWCKIKFTSSSNPMSNGAKLYLNGVELTEATIPSDITTVTENTFYGCTSLTSLTISKRITSIELRAFCNCTSLKMVYCNLATPPQGGYLMFDNNAPDRMIYVPRESVEAYKVADQWKNYADSIVGYDF